MILDDLKYARAVGAPIVAIVTADQPSMMNHLQKGLNGAAPLLVWDCAQGYRALNEPGAAARQMLESKGFDLVSLTDSTAALVAAAALPTKSIVLMFNAHRMIERTETMQALMNLRDDFKNSRRTIVLFGPAFTFPAELTQDVLVLREPMPDDPAIRAILSGLWSENGIDATPELLDGATDALRGLAGFPVEQAASLSIKPDKTIDRDSLWTRKREAISQIDGLTIENPGPTFKQIGGQKQAIKFLDKLCAGPLRPRVFVFIDEIDKQFAGIQGDMSGTSQDLLGVFLQGMQDNQFGGVVILGPGGSGKSLLAKAAGATYGIPCVRRDLGAAKGSLVGESERKARAQESAILGMAGQHGAFYFVTCNQLAIMPPELRRRFTYGIWFSDLPDADERVAIGAVMKEQYPTVKTKAADWIKREGWSGANIHDACRAAYALQTSLDEASAFIVPAAMQDPQGLDRLRQMAAGRFLSTSYPGPYQLPKPAAPAVVNSTRRISMEEN
jgi:hypothetical protein